MWSPLSRCSILAEAQSRAVGVSKRLSSSFSSGGQTSFHPHPHNASRGHRCPHWLGRRQASQACLQGGPSAYRTGQRRGPSGWGDGGRVPEEEGTHLRGSACFPDGVGIGAQADANSLSIVSFCFSDHTLSPEKGTFPEACSVLREEPDWAPPG